ncbi:Rab GDP dissociation inhibitor [Cryptosporidium canis]|uniref:Rab GDP dissociation inhibitor n=1 Tax=Cryptosporidium canis TaxID=195482 RepID=A0A9D5DLR7_9CRYT|nr:Rab GDP dissociation inhibitor [Cryptosporidium canis]
MTKENREEGFWDVVIVGTGLIESIVASGLSIKGYSVLVLDPNSSYGGLYNTLKLPTFHAWMSDSPEHPSSAFEMSSFSEKEYDSQAYSCLTPAEAEVIKKIHLDMMPKILYCRGHLVEMILACDISGYLEFQGIEDVYLVDNQSSQLTRTPLSKRDVFSSSDLNLVEKRQVMRLFSGVRDILDISRIEEKVDLDLISDPFRTPAFISNSQNNARKSHPNRLQDSPNGINITNVTTFSDFQDLWKISDRVMDLVKFNIVFSSLPQNDQFDWENNFKRYFNLLLSSLNQHGCTGTPFLYPNYGTCDLPQSFSRLAAVKGSLQRLGTRISSIQVQEGKDQVHSIRIDSNCSEETVRCKLILGALSHISSHTKVPTDFLVEKRVLCCYMVLNQPLITAETSQNQRKLSFAGIKIGQDQSKISIAYLLQCDHLTGCCPNGYYIVYINKVLERHETIPEARNLVQDAISRLLSKEGRETRVLYKGSYIYSQRVENPQILEEGLMLLPDPSVNNNSFFLLDEDIDKAILTLDKSLKFLNSQTEETTTFQSFSSPKGLQETKREPTNQEYSDQYVIKRLQSILG